MIFPSANGGRPPPGSVCAKHEQQLDEHDERLDAQDDAQGAIMRELAEIRTVQGRAPDPVSGDPGSGQMRILHALANELLTGRARSPLQSLIDDSDEGEVTRNLERPALVDAKHSAERRTRIALIALASTIVTTAGAVALAWLAGH